ncbi:serine/threonine-protein kinase 4 isoform X1 [Prunus yedoensis var. nudiflora]|uniref:Serine/threonine-protein kinase 4 isoform X1 n=1 Tax=Prunus yedoensis var. nudiflora TaxID=2094558 RepID=A0A314V2V7_PRUYE|nr:serine/threonine-protein kinase 4 isoform X1 [Prunus yedoensis var. nudiflora]
MKVLLMTIQNAPPGLDYDRDKKFSKSFKEMVAMCLVKDQTKRPTAEKLLKHSFFKNAKPPELSVKKLFTDLPPLWNRVKALQKMPSAEQEAISQSEYQRGVSAWNFDVEDLKAQASLVRDDDDIPEMMEEDEKLKSVVSYKEATGCQSSLGKLNENSEPYWTEYKEVNDYEAKQVESLNKKGKVLESNILESGGQQKTAWKKNGSSSEATASTSEKDMVQAKTKNLSVKSRQTQSGPLTPGAVLSHSVSERFRIFERSENENQLAIDKAKCEVRRTPSFSGPLMLPNRASANSLSAPIKSSGGFRDSLDDKSKANLDIPSSTIPRRSSQGSPLRKSASVGDWVFESRQMPTTPSAKELNNSNVPASLLLPHLQNLFQQTSIQQDIIMNLLSTLQAAEAVEGEYSKWKLPPLPRSSENNGSVEAAVSERERLLLLKVSELQARMNNLSDELTAEKTRHIQLQQQLNAVSGQEENGDGR